MNPAYLGDSYDLVKRFISQELQAMGFEVFVDPCFTGSWNGEEHLYYQLIDAQHRRCAPVASKIERRALLLDPDTGVNERGGMRHSSFRRIALDAAEFDLVVAFDQAFSRREDSEIVMRTKLQACRALGLAAMFYDSHAHFLFASTNPAVVADIRASLLSVGLPEKRFFN